MTQIESGLVEGPPAIQPDGVESEQKRIVDHLDPRLVNVLTVLGFGVPIAAYFWFVGTYSVNVLTNDQWTDIPVIQDTWSHLDWSALWLPHNESRVFFPNVIVVLLAHTVHFNIRVEELVSAVMLTAATAILIWAHRRRSPSTPWLYYCPVAILALSFVQSGNALWGFQMAWYLTLLSLAASIALIDRFSLDWVALVGAVSAAVVGSFSSVQGLLIWPIGLILLYHRRRTWPYAGTWSACAIATVILYYHHFTNKAGGRQPAFALHHPLTAIHYLLFLVGDIVGLMRDAVHPGNAGVVLFGLLIVVLAVITVLVYGIRQDPFDGGPVGVCLICFGLGFAIIVTQGRSFLGTVEASGSRYTTFDLLILIGVYLTLLQRPLLGSDAASSQPPGGGRPPSGRRRLVGWISRIGFRWAEAVVVCAIVLQVAIGIPNGLQDARLQHSNQVHAAYVLRTIDHRRNTEVAKYLDAFDNDVYLRAQARTARRLRLSLFANLPSGNG